MPRPHPRLSDFGATAITMTTTATIATIIAVVVVVRPRDQISPERAGHRGCRQRSL